MNNNKKIGFVLGLLAFVAAIMWMFDQNESSSSSSRTPFVSANWDQKDDINSKEAQGMYLFNTVLRTHIQPPASVYGLNSWMQHDSLKDPLNERTYLFVGQEFELLNSEVDTLLREVEQGADLMLSFYNLTENLYDRFFTSVSFDYDYGDSTIVKAGKKQFVLFNIFQTDTLACEWEGFGDFETVDSNYTILSSLMEMPNFIRIQHGKGRIFLHANPGFFYNYQVQRKDGYRQAAFFINQIPKNNNVYWLEFGRKNNATTNGDNDEQDGKSDDSYLQLIFKHPSLLMALLLVIVGFILFLVFRAKRMRPVIPYLPKKVNMTLSFADTITNIYFSKQSPKTLLKVKQKNFFDTVLKHFFIDLSRREGDKEIRILAEKSDLTFDEVKSFITALENKKVKEVDDQYLNDIAHKQRAFYQKTGIISSSIQKRLEKKEFRYNRSMILSIFLLMGGIYCILLGFYYLMQSKGVGIILWPVGLSWIIFGALSLQKPLLIVTKTHFTFYSLASKPEIFNFDDLWKIETSKGTVIFHFHPSRNKKINTWKMSRFDKKQFERFITHLHSLGK